MQCSALRKGGHVVIKGRPCKIVDMSTSKTGKHGHAKVHLVALDIFTGKKLEDLCPSTHNMDVPNVRRQEYFLVSLRFERKFIKVSNTSVQKVHIDDGFLNLLDDNGNEKNDVKMPEGDVGDLINKLQDEGKEVSKYHVAHSDNVPVTESSPNLCIYQALLSKLPWVKKRPSLLRKPLNKYALLGCRIFTSL